MRKTLLAIVLLLATQSGWAGVSYEFVQNTRSDIEQIPPTTLTGRAIIDGPRSRIDFGAGNIYAPGAYVISTDASRTLLYVDPISKTYSEVNAAGIAAMYGNAEIKVDNIKTNTTMLDDHPNVAGVPTNHYHLTLSYDMTLQYGTMPLTQKIDEQIDKWTTTQFGDIADAFFANGSIKTGNPKLDELIETETRSIKGFPLRQTVVVRTTSPIAVTGELKGRMHDVRTQQRELLITKIQQQQADASVFHVPSTFRKLEPGEQQNLTKQTQMTVLSFDDGSKKQDDGTKKQ
ncbi:MAG TPA: hypothetical protein VHU41_15015 [Thermoanaerobaculia bacterium]|nr:hypothetical protein [Thermoanaerobaculia bacterium]